MSLSASNPDKRPKSPTDRVPAGGVEGSSGKSAGIGNGATGQEVGLTAGTRALVKYRTIVADPPWAYDEGFAQQSNQAPHKQDRERGAPPAPIVRGIALPYPSLTVSEIAAIRVADFATTDARLFLWATNRYLPDAFMCFAHGDDWKKR